MSSNSFHFIYYMLWETFLLHIWTTLPFRVNFNLSLYWLLYTFFFLLCHMCIYIYNVTLWQNSILNRSAPKHAKIIYGTQVLERIKIMASKIWDHQNIRRSSTIISEISSISMRIKKKKWTWSKTVMDGIISMINDLYIINLFHMFL